MAALAQEAGDPGGQAMFHVGDGPFLASIDQIGQFAPFLIDRNPPEPQ